MAPQQQPGTVVVGVDGSAGGVAAAEWAADEADRRGAPLRLVHGYVPPIPYRFVFPEYDLDVTPVREHAEQLLREVARHVRARHHRQITAVEAEVLEDHPHLLILDLDQVHRVETDRRCGARFRRGTGPWHARTRFVLRGGRRRCHRAQKFASRKCHSPQSV